MKLNERILFFFLHCLSHLVGNINPRRRVVWAQNIGGFVYRNIPTRKYLALKNISRAFPNKSDYWKTQILKNSYSFFMEQFLFFFGFPKSYSQINIKVKNKILIDEALKQRKGVLFITGHFGFWECSIAWFGRQKYPLIGVAMRQKNVGAHQFFIKKREWSGMKHVFRKDSLDKMNKVLDEGGILGLASDQDVKRGGVFVRFFNILSSTPKGAARFYQQKGSIPIFGVCSKEKYNQFLIQFKTIPKESLVNTETFTQAYTQLLENEIRIHPEQYFWWHNRWKTSPPKN